MLPQARGDITIMFLFAVDTQDEHTFADVVRDWRHDGLVFVHRDLPRLVVILAFAFILMRIVGFFVNRMKRLADRQAGNAQRASELRTLAAILRATAYSIIGFIVLLHILAIFGIQP